MASTQLINTMAKDAQKENDGPVGDDAQVEDDAPM